MMTNYRARATAYPTRRQCLRIKRKRTVLWAYAILPKCKPLIWCKGDEQNIGKTAENKGFRHIGCCRNPLFVFWLVWKSAAVCYFHRRFGRRDSEITWKAGKSEVICEWCCRMEGKTLVPFVCCRYVLIWGYSKNYGHYIEMTVHGIDETSLEFVPIYTIYP